MVYIPLLIYRNEYSPQDLHIKCVRNVSFAVFSPPCVLGGYFYLFILFFSFSFRVAFHFYLFFLSREFAVDVGTGSSFEIIISLATFPSSGLFYFYFFTIRLFVFLIRCRPSELSHANARSFLFVCLFCFVFPVLSCPSVGVANDKGGQSGGAIPSYSTLTPRVWKRKETSVRGRNDRLWLVGIVFQCFPSGLRERRVSLRRRINYLSFS